LLNILRRGIDINKKIEKINSIISFDKYMNKIVPRIIPGKAEQIIEKKIG